MKSALRKIRDAVVTVVVVVSVAWTAFSVYMQIRLNGSSEAMAGSQFTTPITLPIVSSPGIFNDSLRGFSAAMAFLDDAKDPPVRMSCVFNADRTAYIELDYISECGCPASKLDRYTLTRLVMDPRSGEVLARPSEANLSSERLRWYLGGLTQIQKGRNNP